MTTPEKLGRYEIISELGKGAMGVVYLGRDPLIGRQLALKTFRLGYSAGDEELEQFRVRFLREAQSAGILSHPNIVTIHDVAVDPGGDFFIAMEYVQGTDLKLVMQRQRFEPNFTVDVVAQIADGLGYAHSKGVVHRDIKPANIIITTDKQAKITDFGIARVEASNLTVEGQLLGTPNYMAPEQIQGKEVDHRADLFSLGVMLFELLTGTKPFAAPNLSAVTHRIVFEPYPPLEPLAPGLPAGFVQVLDRALAKDPAQRYDNGADMAADLRAIYGSASTATQTVHRSGSFLDAAPVAGNPVAGSPVAGTPPTGTPSAVPTTADGTVVTGTAGTANVATATGTGTTGTGTTGVPTATGVGTATGVPVPVGGGTVVTSAPTPAANAPIQGAYPPVPASTPSPALPASGIPTPGLAPPEPPKAGSAGMPIAGRIAAVLGLVAALAIVGVGVSRLMGGNEPTPERTEASSETPSSPVEELSPKQVGGNENLGLEGRLAEAREAMRDRDYTVAIRLANEILEADPDQEEVQAILAEATDGERRRQEIRDRLRNPEPPPAQPGPRPTRTTRVAPPPPTAPPPAAVANATLVVSLRSEVSEGRLTIFTGQQKLYQQPFKFVTGAGGVFSRQRATSGSLRSTLTLPSGELDLKIYVRPKDAQTRSAEVTGQLPPGETRVLKIELSEEGRIKATLESAP